MEKMPPNLPIAELIGAALAARKKAYAPYSGFYVGAAVLTGEDRIYSGCNIENASYGATVCAERTAIYKAVSEGRIKCKAVAVVGSPMPVDRSMVSGNSTMVAGTIMERLTEYAFPCGICRQVMAEFTDQPEAFAVIIAKSLTDYRVFSLAELLPFGFKLPAIN